MSVLSHLCYFALLWTILSNTKVLTTEIESDDCDLDPRFREEINSYKVISQRIMDEIIKNGYGEIMYENFTRFIDKFGARPSGSENLENAIDYMINLAKESGVTDITTEAVMVPHWKRGYESATMLKPRRKDIALLGLGSSVNTSSEGITAEVIVVKSFHELNAMSNNEVKGKIVVYDAQYVNYGVTVKYRSQGATMAAKKGAVASLIRSVTPFSIYSPHTGAQRYEENVTKIPTAAITLEDADLLKRLQDAGEKIVINLKMFNKLETKISRNTIVDLKGKQNPDKLVIVSGHIDSWDVGQGAMDDGAGMMISWFAPVVLHQLGLQPKRTIRAILWTSEEPGLIGAAAYLKKHMNDLSNINFVMESDEGTFNPRGLNVAGTKNAQCILAEILKQFSPINKMTVSSTTGSDIILFVNKGVPGASLLNDNERYFWFHHSAGDTMNVLTKDDVVKCAAFWTAISFVVADLSVDIPRI